MDNKFRRHRYATQIKIEKIINEIKFSINDLNRQLDVDLPRMNVKFNGVVCNTIDELSRCIHFTDTIQWNYQETVKDIVLLMCTQASFFYLIQFLYTNETMNYSEAIISDNTDPEIII